MASTTEGSIDRARLIELTGSPVKDADFDELLKYIRSQPNGDKLLASLSTIPRLPDSTPAPSAQGFTAVASGSINFINLIVYQKIQIKLSDKGRYFDGHSGGIIPGLPGGILWGSITYDNESDLTGSWDYFMFIIAPFVQVEFHRGGKPIMIFKAQGVFGGGGTAWGSGSWS